VSFEDNDFIQTAPALRRRWPAWCRRQLDGAMADDIVAFARP
jgi:hypothetical protein